MTARLPTAGTLDGTWRAQAACVGHDPELWFADSKERQGRRDTDTALRICNSCPVKAECLTETLHVEQRTRHGIYGGTTPDDRRLITRGRRNG